MSGPFALDVHHEPPLTPSATGVVVSLTLCGVCSTDVHAYTSGGLIPPAVFGHEWTGTITAVGDAVTALRIGQRVVASVGPPCGSCPQCANGHVDSCETVYAEAFGVSDGAPRHGGFATQIAVSARRVMATPDGLTDEQAAFAEPTAVTYRAVRRAAQASGAVVVVQGAGPIGLLTAQHARQHEPRTLMIVEPSPSRRAAAGALGFTEVFEPGAVFRTALDRASGGLGADLLYECTGVAALLQPSAELIRRGGQLSLIGWPMDTSEVSYSDWQERELTVIGSAAYAHEDFAAALRALASGVVVVEPLHSGTIGLDALESLLQELDRGDSLHTKVFVDPLR